MPTHTTLTCLDAEAVRDHKAVLCDLDGCLIADHTALPGAHDFAASLKERLWIVSNNSTDTAQTLSEKLSDLGFEIEQGRLVLAGEYALQHLAETAPGARLLCLADAPLIEKAEELGFALSTSKPDHVFLARMRDFNLDLLSEAVGDLAAGASLLVANTDPTHPSISGCPVPETGAWLAALKACLPGLPFESFGKPGADLLAEALRRSGTEPHETVFVGDNPETDGEAAAAISMDFIEINRFSGLPSALASKEHQKAGASRW